MMNNWFIYTLATSFAAASVMNAAMNIGNLDSDSDPGRGAVRMMNSFQQNSPSFSGKTVEIPTNAERFTISGDDGLPLVTVSI